MRACTFEHLRACVVPRTIFVARQEQTLDRELAPHLADAGRVTPHVNSRRQSAARGPGLAGSVARRHTRCFSSVSVRECIRVSVRPRELKLQGQLANNRRPSAQAPSAALKAPCPTPCDACTRRERHASASPLASLACLRCSFPTRARSAQCGPGWKCNAAPQGQGLQRGRCGLSRWVWVAWHAETGLSAQMPTRRAFCAATNLSSRPSAGPGSRLLQTFAHTNALTTRLAA